MADGRRQEEFGDGCEEVFDEITDGAASSEEIRCSSPGSTAHSRGNMESSGSAGTGRRIGLVARLAEILVDQGDGDLVLQQRETQNDFLEWIQALDMQVLGACRADERLKPLLKTNALSSATEDLVLARLSQHFDAAEIGQLARCLCIPLVSIRVGKVIKEGTTFYPTSSRGNLIVALLPSSDLRVSFVGDDGEIERIATLSRISESSSTLTIEEIPVDESGRSFLIRTSGIEIFYFWCAEKSKLLGIELLSKMKGLLTRKPTLASLTGISELRLECLAVELRACLVDSDMFKPVDSDMFKPSSSTSEHCGSFQPQLESLFSPQGSPTSHPHLNSYKKIRNPGDSNIQLFPTLDPTTTATTSSSIIDIITTENCSEYPAGGNTGHNPSLFECLGIDNLPPVAVGLASQHATFGIGSLMSPYYCWCPPMSAAPLSAHHLPFAASVESFTSLLPVSAFPTLLPHIPPLSMGTSVPSLSLPSPSFSSRGPNLFPIFTPLMSDPIVHVPVISVCSSGPGYLVNGGPTALTATVPPLVFTAPESVVVDKGARETLRLLLSGGSSQPSPKFMGIVPSNVLNHDDKVVVPSGSRGMYGGMSDANPVAAVGLAASSFSDGNVCCCDISGKGGVNYHGLEIKAAGDRKGKFGSHYEDGGTFFSTGKEQKD